jgi:hypothetical protein
MFVGLHKLARDRAGCLPGSFGGSEALTSLGVHPEDAELSGAGEIADTTFGHMRQAKIAFRAMMAHLYSDLQSAPQTSEIMQVAANPIGA